MSLKSHVVVWTLLVDSNFYPVNFVVAAILIYTIIHHSDSTSADHCARIQLITSTYSNVCVHSRSAKHRKTGLSPKYCNHSAAVITGLVRIPGYY